MWDEEWTTLCMTQRTGHRDLVFGGASAERTTEPSVRIFGSQSPSAAASKQRWPSVPSDSLGAGGMSKEDKNLRKD